MHDWYPRIEFPCSWETFLQLPRHRAWRYEYWNGLARISGRPHCGHALVSLYEVGLVVTSPRPDVEAMTSTVWPIAALLELTELFAAALATTSPGAQLSTETRITAARAQLERVISGADGLLIPQALRVIRAPTGEPAAAAIVTLFPEGDLTDFSDIEWSVSPPADALERAWGQPHLTWMVVDPVWARRGLATRLLREVAQELLAAGYQRLASTFLVGEVASMMWHWRAGFRLLPMIGPGTSQARALSDGES